MAGSRGNGSGVREMSSRLEALINEKRTLETKLVQVQSMMLFIDSMMAEEMLAVANERGKAS